MSELDKNVARLWEALETQVMKREGFYYGLLHHLTRKGYLDLDSKILCAAAGHGTLYSILLEEGYDVHGNDGSPEMVNRLNMRIGRKHRHEPTVYQWQELAEHFPEAFFDLIITEGNSLLYASSWAKEDPDMTRSIDEIKSSISNKAKILKKGGLWYVDITEETENQAIHDHEGLSIDGETINLRCEYSNDKIQRVRTFSMQDDKSGLKVVLKGKLITGEELRDISVPEFFSSFRESGLKDPHYKGYILRK